MARAKTNDTASQAPWLLLIHQVPPKPDYLRVKVRRRLERLAAVPLKSTVYVLPNRPTCVEDFQWLREEIVADGGEAVLCAASLLDAGSDGRIEALFRKAAGERYGEIASAIRELRRAGGGDGEAAAQLARLRKRLEEAAGQDYFSAPGRRAAERELAELDRELAGPRPRRELAAKPYGATWVTRAGVYVDRIASAWLIRRFIDPRARFRFLDPARLRRYRPAKGELRFDTVGGEYTHEGDRCTFETLVERFGLAQRALMTIGEIVHDLDFKDAKFGRPEAAGVGVVLSGLVDANATDEQRLAAGAMLFDNLYRQFGGQ